MKNGLMLLGVLLTVAAFAGMMRIKTDVQTMDRLRLKLVHERAELRETKRVLEAEWALLSSPERLEKMTGGRGYVRARPIDVIPLVPYVTPTTPSPSAAVAPAAHGTTAKDPIGTLIEQPVSSAEVPLY